MIAGPNGAGQALSVGIVGGGFGGVGAGIRCKQEGYEFEIFERGDSVGGVWRANTYPGAACDVASHLYSFSFAPGHDWSRRYAPREDIIAYLDRITDEFGIRPHLHLGTGVERAEWDDETRRWKLRTESGEEREFNVLIAACGQLANPVVPEIEGLDRFSGDVFHSAAWDDSVELAGKRVAVLGTGASAIQFVPEVAKLAAHTDVYQRSAPWIIPKGDRAYPAWERRLFERFPRRVSIARQVWIRFHVLFAHAFIGRDWVGTPVAALSNLARKFKLRGHPDLIEKTTPGYKLGCKRVLLSDDWFPTLARDDVELHTGAVERVTENGVVGADGVERPADVIICGTGFASHDFVAPMEILGDGGRELNEFWSGRPEAYLGTTVAGFPNLFLIYGPNTNHGAGSVPLLIESQLEYVADAIARLRQAGASSIVLKPAVQQAWREEIQRRSAKTAWVTGGANNWYLNDEGINTNNWPGGLPELMERLSAVQPSEYELG